MLTLLLSHSQVRMYIKSFIEKTFTKEGERRRRTGEGAVFFVFFLSSFAHYFTFPPAFVLYLLTGSVVSSSLVEGSSVRETKLLLVALRLTFKVSRRRWPEK